MTSSLNSATGQSLVPPGPVFDANGRFVRDTSRPLGSGLNPVPPGESRPGWDGETMGKTVVHSDPEVFRDGR